MSTPGQGNIIQMTYIRMLLPHPAIISDVCYLMRKCRMWEPTLSVDPHHGTRLFPLFVGVALSDPHCGSLVMSIACNIEVDGWIGRGKPICRLVRAALV